MSASGPSGSLVLISQTKHVLLVNLWWLVCAIAFLVFPPVIMARRQDEITSTKKKKKKRHAKSRNNNRRKDKITKFATQNDEKRAREDEKRNAK